MEPSKIVLRRMLDDPEKRALALRTLSMAHFLQSEERYLFQSFKDLPFGAISLSSLANYLSRKPLRRAAKELLSKLLGELASVGSVLASDFDCALNTLVADSRREHFHLRLRQAASLAENNRLEQAQEVLKRAMTESGRLSLDDNRTISARSMASLDKQIKPKRYPTGFKHIDDLTGGGRPGELWLLSGYFGEFKSMALIQIAYHNFILGNNVYYVTLEMDSEEIRQRLLTRHAHTLGIELTYKDIDLKEAIHNGKRDAFLKTAQDFDRNKKYGDITIWEPPLKTTIDDVAREFERHSSRHPCQVLILDYIQMLSPLRQRYQGRDEKNETIQRAKRLSMEIANRTWLISGYQTSTEARKKAGEKGYYDPWSLADTIEASRAANVVIWVLATPEMQADCQLKMGILKSRNSSRQGSIHYLVSNPDISFISSEPISEEEQLLGGEIDFEV